jgi:hypothetical protein
LMKYKVEFGMANEEDMENFKKNTKKKWLLSLIFIKYI